MNVSALKESDLVEAAKVLCSSFINYDVMRYFFYDSGDNYEAHITEFFLSFYQFGFANNWPCYGVKINGEWVAVALGCNSTQQHVAEGSDAPLTAFFKKISPAATQRIEHYEQQADAAHPKNPHIFIDSIGTLPAHQGRGYAKALIHKYQELSKADPLSTGVALNTESDENILFYQHLGYEIVAKQRIETITSWSLFRTDE